MPSGSEFARLNEVVLRKAAVEVHWLPDMQVRISQRGKVDLCVGTDGVVDGCLFRQLVVNWLQAGAAPELLEPLDLHRPLIVERRLQRGGVDVDTGIVVTTFDVHHTVVAFSTITGGPGASAPARSESCVVDDVVITEAHDVDLGASLVHASHHTADWIEADRVFGVMRSRHAAMAMEDVAAHLLAAAPQGSDDVVDRGVTLSPADAMWTWR